jgi:hypothetical protein
MVGTTFGHDGTGRGGPAKSFSALQVILLAMRLGPDI